MRLRDSEVITTGHYNAAITHTEEEGELVKAGSENPLLVAVVVVTVLKEKLGLEDAIGTLNPVAKRIFHLFIDIYSAS